MRMVVLVYFDYYIGKKNIIKSRTEHMLKHEKIMNNA